MKAMKDILRYFIFLAIVALFFAWSVVPSGGQSQKFPTRQQIQTTAQSTLRTLAATLISVEGQTPIMKNQVDALRITILYDNHPFDPRLKTGWGFSALIEFHGQTLLFDTGGDGRVLLENMQALEMDPARIQSIVLSHAHGDHTGGLIALLDGSRKPTVYLLPSFAEAYKNQIAQLTQVNQVTSGQVIADDILTTGEIKGTTPEQALLIRTQNGLVIITGCAHPGIVQIIERAVELTGDPVYLVLGGFHLRDKSNADISAILADFRRLGVQNVAPAHCTGENTIALFAAQYGEAFIQTGVGTVITLDQ
jgi:7,8-dihydropterin-6-yl-methyl-4-(beta-D-ribofuranosyl)aminobenzene 5'-phosphate synthase